MNGLPLPSADRLERARAAAASVTDPELPDLTIAELGILRDVTDRDDVVVVTVTPTFSACPAMSAILSDLDRALGHAEVAPYRIETQLRPPWSSDWITPEGREKLRRTGIAPPPRPAVACPHCGASSTVLLSQFGATPCRSLRRCAACLEPFDAVKVV